MRNKKVSIGDKEVTLKLDLNAIIRFCDEYEVNFEDWEESLTHPTRIRFLLWSMSESGGSKMSVEDIGKMDITQMSEVISSINQTDSKEGSSKKKSSASTK